MPYKLSVTTIAFAMLAVGHVAAVDLKVPAPPVSGDLTLPRDSVEALDSRMSYLETGSGEPVLFVHGNPTSAYLWRNILPHAARNHRAVALDLIGMGRSAKPDIGYTFADHARYLEAFIDAMGFERLMLVGHDWGAALAWDFARRYPDRVAGIAFMEGVLPPAFPLPDYAALGPAADALEALRDPVIGEQMVFGRNMFVEEMLPGFVNRTLGDRAMAEYRAPYLVREDRLPTLRWPRELPIGGEPAETTAVLSDIAGFMAETRMPALLIYAEPGVTTPPATAEWLAGTIANLETVFVGPGLHFLQEDHPDLIGRAFADWLRRN